MRQEQSREYKIRLKQITKVLRKHEVRRRGFVNKITYNS